MNGGVLPALLLSTIAGMSTAVGSLIAMFSKRDDTRFLSLALGFSAGVMITVSFAELLPEAQKNLCAAFGAQGALSAVLCLAVGVTAAAFIDLAIPDDGKKHKPHQVRAGNHSSVGSHSSVVNKSSAADSMMHMGIVTAVAITIHNFPEGIATFMAGYADIRIGLPVAFSIAMHNIPEGVAVAVPIYYATGSRAKAFWTSALSGLSEPLGALLAFLCLAPFMSKATLGGVFGIVAGIMIYIAFGELIPASERYGRPRASLIGIISGSFVMLFAMMVFGS